jgi:virginiamycin B lyase
MHGCIISFTAGFTNGYNPSDICVGSDGNLWIVDIANHYIDKVTTAGQVTQFNAYAAALVGGYIGIVSGPDGNIWFTERGSNRIGRIVW